MVLRVLECITGGLKTIFLKSLPECWPGKWVIMDMLGALFFKTPMGETIVTVLADHFMRRVELAALREAEVSSIVSCFRDVWMPKNKQCARYSSIRESASLYVYPDERFFHKCRCAQNL